MIRMLKENDIIRPMIPADIEAVMRIENATNPTPWSEKIMRDCLNVGFKCFSLVVDGAVMGYAIYVLSLYQCHLLNLRLDPALQGKGYGSDFLRFCLKETLKAGVGWMVLEVRPSNPVGIALYTKFGFTQIAVKEKYYDDGGGRFEDALIYGLWIKEDKL